MRKMILTIVAIILCVCITGCESKETAKFQPESSFFEGYNKLTDDDYATYSKTAEENGLGDTKIAIKLTIGEVVKEDFGDPTFGDLICTVGITDKNNGWLAVIDATLFGKVEDYTSLEGHDVWIAGYYQGFSSVKNVPSIFVVKYFDTTDGSEINTVFGTLLEATYESSAAIPQDVTNEAINADTNDESQNYVDYDNAYNDYNYNEPDYDNVGGPSEGQTTTTSQEQALAKANSYLRHSNFSYEGLVGQLIYEGFSESDSRYAVDNCGADWYAQALGKGQSYLKHSAFSYTGLIGQLEYEQFTNDQAVYAANNCGADWYAQAAAKAQSYLKHSSFSHDGLVNQLLYEGFTQEQAEYGVSAVGL